MIKESNTRVIITMTKEQAEWLKKNAKKLKISVSRFIKWLMDKNISRIREFMSDEDWKYLQAIVKTPWINLSDEEIEDTYIGRKKTR